MYILMMEIQIKKIVLCIKNKRNYCFIQIMKLVFFIINLF